MMQEGSDSYRREFTNEELSEIIRGAAARSTGPRSTNVTFDEMLSIGAELGLNSADLEEAAKNIDRDRDARRKMAKRRLEFFHHLASYVAVIGGLFLLNLLTSPGDFWFLYPAIGWGIGLACHAASVYLAEKAIAMGIEPIEDHRSSRRKRRRESREARREEQYQRREERRRRKDEIHDKGLQLAEKAIGMGIDTIDGRRRAREERRARRSREY